MLTAALRWIEYDTSNRQSYLPDILQFVRLHLIPKAHLLALIDANTLLSESSDGMEIISKIFHVRKYFNQIL